MSKARCARDVQGWPRARASPLLFNESISKRGLRGAALRRREFAPLTLPKDAPTTTSAKKLRRARKRISHAWQRLFAEAGRERDIGSSIEPSEQGRRPSRRQRLRARRRADLARRRGLNAGHFFDQFGGGSDGAFGERRSSRSVTLKLRYRDALLSAFEDAASPRKTTTARLNRKMSSSSSRPIFTPAVDFETVVILSTIRRQGARKPLRSFGSIAKRNNGASVGSVVKAQMVNGIRRVKTVVLKDNDGTRLASAILPARNGPDFAAPHSSPHTEAASTKAWSSCACALTATASDCRCASLRKPGARMSGTQI